MKIESSTGRAPGRSVIGASIAVLVVVWSGNFIAAKIGLLYLPSLAMASFRVVLAGVVMIPVYLCCLRLKAFAETAELRRQGFIGSRASCSQRDAENMTQRLGSR